MSKISENKSIERHTKMVEDPLVRQALFKHFSPTFFFHKDEDNFPVHPDEGIQNIIEVKRDEYINIQERHHRELTDLERYELNIINRYFWNNGGFNTDYKVHQNEPDFIQLTARPDGAPKPTFLIFDEKHYGYKVGEKINVTGVAPKGHRKYDETKAPVPMNASIVPTRDGFFIQYEYIYALNNGIYGIRWLRNLLPEWLCKKFVDFGLHYGDAEGVGVHVIVDEKGQATFGSLQTWAHGKKFAQHVNLEECTFDKNGKVCIYVGVGGHPSYAVNFVGRNSPMDLVGDAYKLEPTDFIDVSEDVLNLALDLTKNEQETKHLATKYPKLVASAEKMPGSLSGFIKYADSNPLAHDKVRNQTTVDALAKTHNNYHPGHLFTRLWQFVISAFKTTNKVENIPISALDISALTNMQSLVDTIHEPEQALELAPILEQSVGNSLFTTPPKPAMSDQTYLTNSSNRFFTNDVQEPASPENGLTKSVRY